MALTSGGSWLGINKAAKRFAVATIHRSDDDWEAQMVPDEPGNSI